MLDLQTNAIKSKVWLGGRELARDPVPVQIVSKRFEVKTRVSNLSLRIDRAFVMEGMPNIPNRREFTLPWSDIREPAMLDHIDVLSAVSQPFGLGLWKQEYDVFSGDGTTQTFYMQRRQLLSFATPEPVLPEYSTQVTLYDRSYTDPDAVATDLEVLQQVDIDGAGTPGSGQVNVEQNGRQVGNLWVTKMIFGDVPADAFDNIIVRYVPRYEVVIDQEAPRAYPARLVESRNLKLVEVS